MDLSIDSLLLDQSRTYQTNFVVIFIKTWIQWPSVHYGFLAGKFQRLLGIPDTDCLFLWNFFGRELFLTVKQGY